MSVHLRFARADEYATFAGLFPHLGVDDPTPPESTFARRARTTLFAERAGVVVGYLLYRTSGTEGLVSNLVVRPDAQGLGIGETLMREAARLMRAAGCETWTLNVKQRNARARALYTKLGFSPVRETRVLRMPWTAIRGMETTARDQGAVDVTTNTEWDEGIEQALDLAHGRLAELRDASPGLIFKALIDAGGPFALGWFRPEFPCAGTVRADNIEAAAALLRSYEAHRVAIEDAPLSSWRQSQVQIVVEGQTDLAVALCGLGAEEVFRLDFMRGTLAAEPQRTNRLVASTA